MTDAVHYPSTQDPAARLPRRWLLWVMYYVCWAAALLAPATVAASLLCKRLGHPVDGDTALRLGAAFGAAAGITLGYWLRRHTWPHLGPIALGVPVVTVGLVMLYLAPAGPGEFLWEITLVLYAMVATNGLALCCAGASGLALNRVPPQPAHAQ